ncbi:MAG: IS1182 family transposase [Bacteroidales bacterium]|jgi:transposase/bacterioferritin (cytochrome b1)|nr:IS1182 family transposase [Bacteroidales bacterium]
MSFINPISRDQLILPSFLDDYVSSDNFVRFIDAFVDKVLQHVNPVLLFQKGNSIEGRPSYSPNCLCKLLIYGYFNSISSSRKLEKETERNLEVMWLMNNLRPDHWTISDFRKENKELIKQITIEFRKFLRDSGYAKGKSVSTDGSKIKAYASRNVISIKKIDKKLEHIEKEIERYLAQVSENDAIENEQEEMLTTSAELKNQISNLQEQIKELESQKMFLKTIGRESYAPSDLEAKTMKTRNGFMPAYNVQSTVDDDSHFIMSCEVTDHPIDIKLLEENVNTLKEQLDIVPKVIRADCGYGNEEQIQSLEKQGIECIVPLQDGPAIKKKEREKGITFSYDDNEDCFKCTQGKKLLLVKKNCKFRKHFYNRYKCKECTECSIRERCTTSETGRIVYKRVDGEWRENHEKKSKTKEFKEKLKKRKCVVEHPFGTMKYYMGQIPILLRGKEKVQVEMDLYATGYNLIRLRNIEFVPTLLEKLEKWNLIPGFIAFLLFFFRIRRLLFYLDCLKNFYYYNNVVHNKNNLLNFHTACINRRF